MLESKFRVTYETKLVLKNKPIKHTHFKAD